MSDIASSVTVNGGHVMSLSPKQIRKARGLTIIAAAVHAHKAEATIRVYEANRDAVSEATRADLDRFYAELARAPEVAQ